MKSKKLGLIGIAILTVILALHFIPLHNTTVTACAAQPLTKNARYILGASKSSVDEQAQAIQDFNKNLDCSMNKITFKLFLL